MLALPLQALASAAMLGCAGVHAGGHEAPAMAAGVMDDCHGSGAPEMPAPVHDCKHCAACTLGAVLPIPSADRLAAPLPAAGPAAQPATVYSGFIPDGPERPPRPFLA